jgi:hypothetical protein
MVSNLRRKWLIVVVALLGGGLAGLLLIGCAAIVHGSKQPMSIASQPAGATVTVDGKQEGLTPVTLKLARKDEHTVKLDLTGYKPFEMKLTKSLDGWFWGNLLLGGIIGMVVDAGTGSMYRLSPKEIEATLKQEGVSMRIEKDMLMVGITMSPNPGWQKIGQLERSTP